MMPPLWLLVIWAALLLALIYASVMWLRAYGAARYHAGMADGYDDACRLWERHWGLAVTEASEREEKEASEHGAL